MLQANDAKNDRKFQPLSNICFFSRFHSDC